MKYSKTHLWLEFLHPSGLCGLCGNTGYIDTRGVVFSPAGHNKCGVRQYCICPNGRAFRKINTGSKWEIEPFPNNNVLDRD